MINLSFMVRTLIVHRLKARASLFCARNNILSGRALVGIILCVSTFLSTALRADLMVSPTRAVLDERNRSTQITLLNTTSETRTYQIEWQELRQTEIGTYEVIREPGPQFHIASPMLRHSPRRVTIAPGSYQRIRLRLRAPADLADGEYRSHLLMKRVANSDVQGLNMSGGSPGEKMSIQFHVNLSFSIPVIVRKGLPSNENAVTSVTMAEDDTRSGEKKPSMMVQLSHKGVFSSFGSVLIYMQAQTDAEVETIGMANNVALFRETSSRKIAVPLQVTTIPTGALIKVEYRGREEYEGQLLGESVFRYQR